MHACERRRAHRLATLHLTRAAAAPRRAGYREEIASLQTALQAQSKLLAQSRRDPRLVQVAKLTEDVAGARRDARAAWDQAEAEVERAAQLEAELQQALRENRAERARRAEAEAAVKEEALEAARASEQFTSDRQALQARIDRLSGEVAGDAAAEKTVAELEAQLEAARREAAEARGAARAQHRESNRLQVVIVEQTQLLEQTEEARQLEAAVAKESRIAAAEQAAVALQGEADECARLREELERMRVAAEEADEERVQLGRSLSSADMKVRRISREQVGLSEHLGSQLHLIDQLRTQLASSEEEAQRRYLAIDTLERRVAADGATIAELRRQLREQEQLLRLQQQQLEKLREQLEATGRPAAMAPPAAVRPTEERKGPPMSGSNFAKMMSMQLEINQLQMMNAHLESLAAGKGRMALRKGQLSARSAVALCPRCSRGLPLEPGIRMTSEVHTVDYEVKLDGRSSIQGKTRLSPSRLSPTRALAPGATAPRDLSPLRSPSRRHSH